MAESIFKFEDKFGYESPFGDWLADENLKDNVDEEPPKILDVEVKKNLYWEKYKVSVTLVIKVSKRVHKLQISLDRETKTIINDGKKQLIFVEFVVTITNYYKDCLFDIIIFDIKGNSTEKRSVLRQIPFYPVIYQINETCFCNDKSLSISDLRYVVSRLRQLEKTFLVPIRNKSKENSNWLYINKKTGEIKPSKRNGKSPGDDYEIYRIQQTTYDKDDDKLFFLKSTQNVDIKYQNYVHFTKFLNLTFVKYKINTCLRKIHFLAQIYTESDRFKRTYETDGSAALYGGGFYRGRGLIQVTHKDGYEKFYEHLFKKKPNEKQLKDFVPKVATNLEYAVLSAGWYWDKNNINRYADADDLGKVSAAINHPASLTKRPFNTNSINGMDDREKFYKLLKIIFNYEDCKK